MIHDSPRCQAWREADLLRSLAKAKSLSGGCCSSEVARPELLTKRVVSKRAIEVCILFRGVGTMVSEPLLCTRNSQLRIDMQLRAGLVLAHSMAPEHLLVP